MTVPEPNGMGLPVPDTNAPDNGGNGKIDVYFLAPNQCRDRNGTCVAIPGSATAAAPSSKPCNAVGAATAPGFPVHACSAYILMPSSALADATPTRAFTELRRLLVHEFFHALQNAHNWSATYYAAGRTYHWYEEASATWAEWNYSSSLGFPRTEPFADFENYQKDSSLVPGGAPLGR